MSSSLQAETPSARSVVSRRSTMPGTGSRSVQHSDRTYVMSMHISKPKTIWYQGLYRAKKIWRSVRRQQRRKSRQSHLSFLATNLPQQDLPESTHRPISQLSDVEAQRDSAFVQHNQHRDSPTPSIVRTTPSNRRHIIHVGPSEEVPVSEKRRSLRFSHPMASMVFRAPTLASARSSLRASSQASPRSIPLSSYSSRSSDTTATSITGKTNPFAAATETLGSRPERLDRTATLNRIDDTAKISSNRRGINRISRRMALREAGMYGSSVPVLPYFPKLSLRTLVTKLENITGEDDDEIAQERQKALDQLVGEGESNTTAEQTEAASEAINAWRQTSEFFRPGDRESRYPGQQAPYSVYKPLPSIMEQAVPPTPWPSTSQHPAATRVVTPPYPFAPDDIGRDKGKKAADPQVQLHLEEARRELEPDTVPHTLQPGQIRESRFNYPLPPLPPATPTPPPTNSVKRKPIPPRPVVYQDAAIQTEAQKPLRKRDLFAKIVTKKYYYE